MVTLIASDFTPKTNDLSTGVTELFASAANESGEMIIYDNSV